MHFTLLIFVFLATALSVRDACARPTSRRMVTMSFSRVRSHYQPRRHLHAQVHLQQRINRIRRRLSRFVGREPTPDAVLRKYILERVARHSPSQTGMMTRSLTAAPNSIPLGIEAHDVGYFATIQIGTPLRDFNVLMDSGSSDLWVSGENCQTEKDGKATGASCGSNHTIEGASTSSSFVDTHKPWNITYGTGAVSGNIVTDKIIVAGLLLDQHTFGVGLLESSDFTDPGVPYDGLMGLALSTLSNQGVLTPPEAMVKEGLIKEAIVSYKISRAADGNGDGEITFGGLDDTKFIGSTLVTVDNISKNGFWEAPMGAISVDGKDTGLTGRTAILDTGTTLVLAPAGDAQKVHDAIPGAKSDGMGGFTIPCNTTTIVSMTFGGGLFYIDPRDLVTGPVDENDPTGLCISGIVADRTSDNGATQWLVGDVFLKDTYFSTNVNKNKISLARLLNTTVTQ